MKELSKTYINLMEIRKQILSKYELKPNDRLVVKDNRGQFYYFNITKNYCLQYQSVLVFYPKTILNILENGEMI